MLFYFLKFRKHLFFYLASLLWVSFLLPLTSCFTGIESTKKINLSREQKKLSAPSPEEKFMEQLQPQKLKSWEPGKRFLVSDNRALAIIVPQEGFTALPPDSIRGEVLRFEGVKSKMSPSGQLNVTLVFTDGDYTYAYDTGKEFEDAMENITSDKIPMLIDEDMVNQARLLLSGRKVWSKTNLWYDSLANRIEGRKFIDVEIIDVKPGDMVFPLLVEFKDPDNMVSYVFMNFGNADNESRSFHNLFSFSDIRKHYSSIDDENWQLISRGKVKEGMTKEECKLALGNPMDINSGHDYSQTLDIWSYDNGKVLWFEDGRLVKIRQ